MSATKGMVLLRGLRSMSKIGVTESAAHTPSMRMRAPAFRRYNFSTTLPTTRDANQDMAMTENEMNRRAAQIVFNDIRENQRAARAAQIFFTKWIINTLCLMHSGSIVALLLQAHVSGRTAPASLWWFVCGIVFVFGAAFAALSNFAFAVDIFERRGRYRVLVDPNLWPAPLRSHRLTLTLAAAVICSVLSLVSLLGGAWAAYR